MLLRPLQADVVDRIGLEPGGRIDIPPTEGTRSPLTQLVRPHYTSGSTKISVEVAICIASAVMVLGIGACV